MKILMAAMAVVLAVGTAIAVQPAAQARPPFLTCEDLKAKADFTEDQLKLATPIVEKYTKSVAELQEKAKTSDDRKAAFTAIREEQKKGLDEILALCKDKDGKENTAQIDKVKALMPSGKKKKTT
ncbi:MAG TPA: hypothetical protein VJB14_04345 [Planctomycetota bacterium]|nr:hypothetical protein [Planctomycetota bacterium]